MTMLTRCAISLAESGLVPDSLIRRGIRALCKQRLRDLSEHPPTADLTIDRPDQSIAEATEQANEQHYEMPPEFFAKLLGPALKYSCGYFDESRSPGTSAADRLDAAEQAALDFSIGMARIENGQRILELGCGWGSLTLSLAKLFPDSPIVAVSNSQSQRGFIMDRLPEYDRRRVEVVTADVNEWAPRGRFDRVVSIEMFEHVRNWRRLLERVHSWLDPDGRLYLHVFAHQERAYFFDDADPSDWMSRHFFTGGLMPSRDLPGRFPDLFAVEEAQWWPGTHYRDTAEEWLHRLDLHHGALLKIVRSQSQVRDPGALLRRWRLFILACAETFGFRGGTIWGVSHHRLRPVARPHDA